MIASLAVQYVTGCSGRLHIPSPAFLEKGRNANTKHKRAYLPFRLSNSRLAARTMDSSRKFDIHQMMRFLSNLPREDYCTLDTFFPPIADPHSLDRFHLSAAVPKLLDALVFALHTEPKDGKTYALTLGVCDSEILATLAGNRAADVSILCPNSPQVILETIWSYMSKLSTVVHDQGLYEECITDFTSYYVNLNSTLIRHRFNKRSQKYEEFWKRYQSREPKGNLIFVQGGEEYLERAHRIYLSTQRFCDTLESGAKVSPDRDSVREYFDTAALLCEEMERGNHCNPVILLVLTGTDGK